MGKEEALFLHSLNLINAMQKELKFAINHTLKVYDFNEEVAKYYEDVASLLYLDTIDGG